MQIDMHYYGVYALARSAGLNEEAAGRIADASQFVDDYTEERDIETSDGSLISYWPSGHGLVCNANLDPMSIVKADPHKVWVPFHFLPGCKGTDYAARMHCGKDSEIARAAVRIVLSRDKELLTPELVGVLTHIYADTFSHYGFSGLRSDKNVVDSDSIKVHDVSEEMAEYISKKAQAFFDKLKGLVAGTTTRGLGHCCVADYPDRPYLTWEFKYAESKEPELRKNPETFMEACKALFDFFSQFKDRMPNYEDDKEKRDFNDMEGVVKEILEFEGTQEERVQKWQSAASKGTLLFNGRIPEYRNSINGEISAVQNKPLKAVRYERVCQFTLAVESIRSMILYELLPKYGLIG